MDFNDANIIDVCKVLANYAPYHEISSASQKVLTDFGISKSRCIRIINQLRPCWYSHHKESRYVLTRLVRDPVFEQRYRDVCRQCLTGDTDAWIDELKSEHAPKYPSLKKSKQYNKNVNTYAWSVYTQPSGKV